MLSPVAYRVELRAVAQALRQEGLSQAQVGRELGVPRPTITKWLNSQKGQNEPSPPDVQNDPSASPPPCYLVVEGTVEKFRPPDGVTFPLIIADPPWNISDPGHKRERKARPNRPFTKDFGTWDTFKSDRAYLARCRRWLDALYDVAAPDAWLFFWCSYRYFSHILVEGAKVGWRDHTFFVWHKTNPLPLFGNNNFLQAIELVLIFAKGNSRFRFAKKGGHQPHNWFQSPQVSGVERLKNHDGGAVNLTQKPLGLTSLFVQWGTKPGDWVLDAFAGTGTATIAALQAGRNACAVERDPAFTLQIGARILRECQAAPWQQ